RQRWRCHQNRGRGFAGPWPARSGVRSTALSRLWPESSNCASDADPSEADPDAQESELKRRLRLAMAQQEPHDKNRGEARVFVPSERYGEPAIARLGNRRAGI